MTRSDGERQRIEHQIKNLRALVDGFEISFRTGHGLSENAHSVLHAAGRLLDHASRLDAYGFAESDALPSVCEHCDDTHTMQIGDRNVLCTRCPTPCRRCASHDGTGAYCARPRCSCSCHEERS